MENIQHSTPNIQLPMRSVGCCLEVGRSMLGVECSHGVRGEPFPFRAGIGTMNYAVLPAGHVSAQRLGGHRVPANFQALCPPNLRAQSCGSWEASIISQRPNLTTPLPFPLLSFRRRGEGDLPCESCKTLRQQMRLI